MTSKILWGFKPSMSNEPLKLCKYSRAEFERRQGEGWALEVCESGEEPTYLKTLTAESFTVAATA